MRSPSRLKRLKRISRLSSKKEEDDKETEVQKKQEGAARRVTATMVFPARPPKTAPPSHSLTFLPEESRQQLIDQLKDEWEVHNKMLQRYSLSLNYLDSISRVSLLSSTSSSSATLMADLGAGEEAGRG